MTTFISELDQREILGLILLVVIISILINSIYMWHLANQSKLWPKVKGTVESIKSYNNAKRMIFEYGYQVQDIVYKNQRIFFSNSKQYRLKHIREFRRKYSQGQQVEVFYNPNNPKIAVLEPGRKDGVVLAVVISALSFMYGYIAFFNQELHTEITEKLFQLFN
ncbi:DUF3592 domain-containing protein [Yeosuana marina]|uniref:DUF3592 domain-containing protein n=1 Tax=Yeosuana marina TaxID=1565536 RepID=UPI0030EC5A17|tara:strand:+ start:2275 stop:2766 length:492 start_codon:yes stop_codon:yes gene_type:complete